MTNNQMREKLDENLCLLSRLQSLRANMARLVLYTSPVNRSYEEAIANIRRKYDCTEKEALARMKEYTNKGYSIEQAVEKVNAL